MLIFSLIEIMKNLIVKILKILENILYEDWIQKKKIKYHRQIEIT